jgi:hypothetical protein
MKKLSLAFGYGAVIFTVIFAFFKACHAPGANISLIIAGILFGLGYAPTLWMLRNKLADTKAKKYFNLLVMITMLFGAVAILSANFHCPQAQKLACFFYTLLVLVILYQIYLAVVEKDESASLGKHNIALVAALSLTIFAFIDGTTISKSVMDEFNCIYGTQNQEIAYFEGKADGFFENLDKNSGNPAAAAYYDKAVKVNAMSDSLIAFIKSLGEEMMLAADSKPVSFDSLYQLKHKANKRVVEEILYDQKKDSLLMAKYQDFIAFMSENTNSRGREILEMFFACCTKDTVATPVEQDTTATKTDTTQVVAEGKVEEKTAESCAEGSCGSCCCEPCTLICTLITLNSDILHIRMLQAETMNYLQTMQSKALIRGEVKEETKD